MSDFTPVYIPAGVGTFHMESAQDRFEASVRLLKGIDSSFICPEDKLLSVAALDEFIGGLEPDAIVFQNLTFANAAYMSAVLRRFSCPVLLWTLREPVIDGGRLRLNSLTGAYSAANALMSFGVENFEYVFGAPEETSVAEAISAFISAAKIKKQMRSLKMSAVGHTPEGFGFGRALDADLMSAFGVELKAVEAREIINLAKSYPEGSCAPWAEKTGCAVCGLDKTPENNVSDYARLYRAYEEYVTSNGIGALASRCWPDFFTDFGTPVCTVLSMLNDDGVAAACEADIYGALSMWIGMQLSGSPAFFGDPVSLDEGDNSITFWHCGACACSLARKDTGAEIGVHPNRKIGPAMNFGCEAFPEATIFRIGRKPDGSFRFFIAEGSALDKPRQFIGTSVVVQTEGDAREIVEGSVKAGFEPHFAVIRGSFARELEMLAGMLGCEVCKF